LELKKKDHFEKTIQYKFQEASSYGADYMDDFLLKK